MAMQSGGVSESTMREILLNPAKVGMKPPVLKAMRRRLKIREDGKEDEWLRDEEKMRAEGVYSRSALPPDEIIDPDDEEDYWMSINPT